MTQFADEQQTLINENRTSELLQLIAQKRLALWRAG